MIAKHKILELYYINHYKQCEIVKMLGVSKSSVSRTVMGDSRYIEEKTRRKIYNREKNRQQTIEYIITKRKSKGIDVEYEALKRQHIEATKEMSERSKPISNVAYRNWNTSAYKYSSKTKSYVLKKDITAGVDVPKRIKW